MSHMILQLAALCVWAMKQSVCDSANPTSHLGMCQDWEDSQNINAGFPFTGFPLYKRETYLKWARKVMFKDTKEEKFRDPCSNQELPSQKTRHFPCPRVDAIILQREFAALDSRTQDEPQLVGAQRGLAQRSPMFKPNSGIQSFAHPFRGRRCKLVPDAHPWACLVGEILYWLGN